MRCRHFTVAVALTLMSSLTLSSCIGSFALTNKLLTWNKQVGNKFVNELVFLVFWCVPPVYQVSALADLLVINTIEFWSGNNPIASSRTVVEGENGRFLVDRDKSGYTITSEADGSVVRLDFDESDNSWSVTVDDTTYPLMTFVDDTHVKVPAADGSQMIVELSEQGVYAYESMTRDALMMASR